MKKEENSPFHTDGEYWYIKDYESEKAKDENGEVFDAVELLTAIEALGYEEILDGDEIEITVKRKK